jgi:1-acyl-sn-glycerol-3-phosphate acyltransferase
MATRGDHHGYRFYPPRHVPWALALAAALMPLYLRAIMSVVRVEIEPADSARLRALLGQRVMLTPNHPSYEPAVLYWLSRRLGQRFCWLAAREVFEQWQQGWLVSRVGAFSVDRGIRDEQSLEAARSILAEGRNWLVLFPEGQEYYLHDTILPFLPGAARTGFEALDAMQALGVQQPLYIVPVALRYYYGGDMRPRMESLLSRLEQRLGLSTHARAAGQAYRDWLHLRLSFVADRVLDANEELYNVDPGPEDTIQQRLDRLREKIMASAAETLGTALPDPALPLRNRLRKLFNAANAVLHGKPELPGDYGRELLARRQRRAVRVKAELRRVIQFVALNDSYALEVPTVERFMDTLGRLEMEVSGRLRFYPPRVVRITVGEPIDLAAHYADWQARGEEAAEDVTEQLEQAVRTLLKSSRQLMTEIPQ